MVELAFPFAFKILIVAREESRLFHNLAGGWREVDYLKFVCASFLKRVVPAGDDAGDSAVSWPVASEAYCVHVKKVSVPHELLEGGELIQADISVSVDFSLGETQHKSHARAVVITVRETVTILVVATHTFLKKHVPWVNSWPCLCPDWRERSRSS
jgi:hypothetical protein